MTGMLRVKAFHADGTCYRSWEARVVFEHERGVVTETAAGNRIDDWKGQWTTSNPIRAFYWFDRPYNLLEVYEPDGTLAELYIHIASPAQLEGGELRYTDHELDVVLLPAGEPFVADEEEFQQAISVYSYSAAFQQQCRRSCEEALALIAVWRAGVPPEEALRTRV